MDGGQTLKVSLQAWAERRIKSVARTPECVAAGLRAGDHLERGGARRLQLVRSVRVPAVDAGIGTGVGAQGTEIVHDCFVFFAFEVNLEVLAVRFKDEPWTSSKPGSFGTAVVAFV